MGASFKTWIRLKITTASTLRPLPFRASCAIFTFHETAYISPANALLRITGPEIGERGTRFAGKPFWQEMGAWRIMLRAFLALEIPPEIQNAIANSTATLRNALPKGLIRWVARKNVHLTLKFLGDVTPAAIEKLAGAIKLEAASHETFSMSVGELGAFPSARRARVLWIGLEAPPALGRLQRGVEAVTTSLGYPAEERPFSPHLTIGRVGQNASASDLLRLSTALEATKVGLLGQVPVEAVHIFKSDLRPDGAVYTHLYALLMKSN
jgi:RNA 2',3'-cyclic 3'-phosphodiesterase